MSLRAGNAGTGGTCLMCMGPLQLGSQRRAKVVLQGPRMQQGLCKGGHPACRGAAQASCGLPVPAASDSWAQTFEVLPAGGPRGCTGRVLERTETL